MSHLSICRVDVSFVYLQGWCIICISAGLMSHLSTCRVDVSFVYLQGWCLICLSAGLMIAMVKGYADDDAIEKAWQHEKVAEGFWRLTLVLQNYICNFLRYIVFILVDMDERVHFSQDWKTMNLHNRFKNVARMLLKNSFKFILLSCK